MTEKQTQNPNRSRPTEQNGMTGEQHDHSQNFAGQVGSAISRAMSAAEADRKARSEVITSPRTRLDLYKDGAVIKTYRGPQKLSASELAKVADDPGAVDVGPVLIRAVGQRTDGSLERRILFFNGRAMMGAAVAPDGSVRITKSEHLDEAALQQTADIEIGKPWNSPVGNVGQVKSVSVPQIYAFAAEDLSYPGPGGPQPLAEARDLLEQFEQTQ